MSSSLMIICHFAQCLCKFYIFSAEKRRYVTSPFFGTQLMKPRVRLTRSAKEVSLDSYVFLTSRYISLTYEMIAFFAASSSIFLSSRSFFSLGLTHNLLDCSSFSSMSFNSESICSSSKRTSSSKFTSNSLNCLRF